MVVFSNLIHRLPKLFGRKTDVFIKGNQYENYDDLYEDRGEADTQMTEAETGLPEENEKPCKSDSEEDSDGKMYNRDTHRQFYPHICRDGTSPENV